MTDMGGNNNSDAISENEMTRLVYFTRPLRKPTSVRSCFPLPTELTPRFVPPAIASLSQFGSVRVEAVVS